MVKTQKLVPEVYYNRSRDFQLLGRVYDIIFNYIKMNADLINNSPYEENIDDKLIALVCSTLGFKETHEYNTKQLKALCSIFVGCLRHKGTLASVQDLLNLLVNVENQKQDAYAEPDIENPYLLNIYMPLDISDTSLFEDVLFYILPAGVSYRLVKEIRIPKEIQDVVYLESDLIGKSSRVAVHASQATELHMSQVREADNVESDEILQVSAEPEVGRLEDMTVVRLDNADDKNPSEIEEPIKPLPKEEEGE